MDVPEIDVELLEDHLAAGATLIDVRQPDEYTDGHIAGATLLPLGELPDRLGEIPVDAPVYIICRSGQRSLTGTRFLIDSGVDATNVVGGMLAWAEAGKAIIAGDEQA